jgi:peptide/nickel transport system permease protein
MFGYLARRLTLAIPVLLGILFVTFSLARLLPGDPCRSTLGEKATDEVCDAFNERYGLNDPIHRQFWIYLKDVARGDLGESLKFGRPVTELMVERLPVTVELSFFAMMFAVLIGIPLGLISAYYHNSAIDVGTMIGANIGVSMPVFWLGLMLSYLFGVAFKDTPLWLPPTGRLTAGIQIEPFYAAWGLDVNGDALTLPGFIANINTLNAVLVGDWDGFQDAIRHMILPAIALGTIPMSIIARMTRSSLLELCADGAGQGREGDERGAQTRLAQRNVAGGHHHWPVAGCPAQRGGAHRDDLWTVGGGTHIIRFHHRT